MILENTLDHDGSIGLYPKAKESSLKRDYPFLSLKNKKMEESDYEDIDSEEEALSMEKYEGEEGEEYDKMMNEIDDDIQEEMMKDLIMDRNNEMDEQDLFRNDDEYMEKLEELKNSEGDEWEDVDQPEQEGNEDEDEEEDDEEDGDEILHKKKQK